MDEAAESGENKPTKVRDTSKSDDAAELQRWEEAKFTVERFVITIEAGTAEFSRPMIRVESSLDATVRNWSERLEADANTQLQVSYYNEAFSVWEPVVEPVLSRENNGRWEPWKLTAKVQTHGEDEIEFDENGTPLPLPPRMAVTIEAKEMMNTTVTKSLLQLTTQLAKVSFL